MQHWLLLIVNGDLTALNPSNACRLEVSVGIITWGSLRQCLLNESRPLVRKSRRQRSN